MSGLSQTPPPEILSFLETQLKDRPLGHYRPNFFFPIWTLAYLDRHEIQYCLTHFYAGFPAEDHQSELLALLDTIKHGPFQEAKETLAFLQLIGTNIHSAVDKSSHGLFRIGSKFSHSCLPNTSWHFEFEEDRPFIVYTALRPISEGDMLTFSYVGDGMSLLQDHSRRQIGLENLGFSCLCARCQSPCRSRRFPCFACGAEDLWEIQEDHWECGSCGSGTRPSPEIFEFETDFHSQLGYLLKYESESSAWRAAQEVQEFYFRVSRILGRTHYISLLGLFAYLNKSVLFKLKNAQVCPFDEEQVKRQCLFLISYFRDADTQFMVGPRRKCWSLVREILDLLGYSSMEISSWLAPTEFEQALQQPDLGKPRGMPEISDPQMMHLREIFYQTYENRVQLGPSWEWHQLKTELV